MQQLAVVGAHAEEVESQAHARDLIFYLGDDPNCFVSHRHAHAADGPGGDVARAAEQQTPAA